MYAFCNKDRLKKKKKRGEISFPREKIFRRKINEVNTGLCRDFMHIISFIYNKHYSVV